MGIMKYSMVTLLLILYVMIGYGVVELKASHHHDVYTNLQSSSFNPNAYQRYRTAYHFQPLRNWINDPAGPVLYKGIYHLFYQYNPRDVVWGPPVWGHSTSKDLVNWTPQPIAIGPQIPANQNGSWTGSTTILPGNIPAILFTGITPQNQQVQDLAFPKDFSDPYLKEWNLISQNPVMAPTPQNHINASSFRDPTTAWRPLGIMWRVLVGNKQEGTSTGVALLFRSWDFVNWSLADHPLYSYKDTGMWECPDFFPVYTNKGTQVGAETSTIGPYVKHVLKVSLDDTKHDIYTVGSYDFLRDVYTPDVGFQNDSSLRYDYGKYYASKTFYDAAHNRRILLGWLNESSTMSDDRIKGWSGIHAIPRKIWLDAKGKQLMEWPIAEIETLRENPVRLPYQVIRGGSLIPVSRITAAQADVEIRFKVSELNNVEKLERSWINAEVICSQKGASVNGEVGPFGLLTLASEGLEEYTAVFFRIFKVYDDKFVVLMCSDQTRSSLNPTTDKTTYGTFVDVDPICEGLSLRILIDHSVVESFGANGKSVITARVYPTLALDDKAYLYAFNYGTQDVEITSLNAWSMKKANIA